MKKITTVFSLLLLSAASMAQGTVRTSFSAADLSLNYTALIATFTKDSAYHLSYPKRLTYHVESECTYGIFLNNNTFRLSGKNLPSANDGNVDIQVSSPGISNVELSNVRQELTNKNDPASSKGWLGNLTFQFPFIINISRNGQLIKSITYYSNTYQAKMSFNKELVDPSLAYSPNKLFASSDEINNSFKSIATKKIIEATFATQTYNKISEMLFMLYGTYSFKGMSAYYGVVRPRGRKFDYSDFDASNEAYKAAIKLHNVNDFVGRDSLMKVAKEGYTKMLNSGDKKIDINVKDMLLHNLAWCSYYLNEKEDFNKYLAAYSTTDTAKWDPSSLSAFNNTTGTLGLRELLNNCTVCTINP